MMSIVKKCIDMIEDVALTYFCQHLYYFYDLPTHLQFLVIAIRNKETRNSNDHIP